MKYRFELSSRTFRNITVEKKHVKIINGLKCVLRSWGINDGNYTVPEFADGIIAVFTFDKILGKSITGNIIYRYRSMLENH